MLNIDFYRSALKGWNGTSSANWGERILASHGALIRYAFKGAALMSCDMIGLVAFDFVLGIVFRGVMHMPLVVEVRGVDGNDCACHSTRFGIQPT